MTQSRVKALKKTGEILVVLFICFCFPSVAWPQERDVNELIQLLKDRARTETEKITKQAIDMFNKDDLKKQFGERQVQQISSDELALLQNFFASIIFLNEKSVVETKKELVRIGTSAVRPLIALLKDEDPLVVIVAIATLSEIGDSRAFETLTVALKEKDPLVSSYASIALSKIGDPRAINPLVAAMKRENSIARILIAFSLGKMGEKRGVNTLVKILLKDDSPLMRNFAAAALMEIGDRKAIDALVEGLTHWHAQPLLVRVLTRLDWRPVGNTELIHFLIAQRKGHELRKHWDLTRDILLKDVGADKYHVIENALYAFIGIGKLQIIPVLIEKLHKEGNKIMAEAYLNCGNEELDKAAREWAAKRGYTITSGSGAHPIGWGSMR